MRALSSQIPDWEPCTIVSQRLNRPASSMSVCTLFVILRRNRFARPTQLVDRTARFVHGPVDHQQNIFGPGGAFSLVTVHLRGEGGGNSFESGIGRETKVQAESERACALGVHAHAS